MEKNYSQIIMQMYPTKECLASYTHTHKRT